MNIPILTPIINAVGSYFENRQNIKADEKKREDELVMAQHQAKVERIKRGDTVEADYDLAVLEASKHSFIDEAMIIWVLAVVTCLFIPALAPYAIAGFAALQQVPLWFQTVFVGCFIAKLGLRFLFSGRTLFGKKVK